MADQSGWIGEGQGLAILKAVYRFRAKGVWCRFAKRAYERRSGAASNFIRFVSVAQTVTPATKVIAIAAADGNPVQLVGRIGCGGWI